MLENSFWKTWVCNSLKESEGDTKQQSYPAQNLFPLLSQAIQALSGNSF
jgi:hypothetical protein